MKTIKLLKKKKKGLKKCPYCAEEIKNQAKVCKHCKKKVPRYRVAKISLAITSGLCVLLLVFFIFDPYNLATKVKDAVYKKQAQEQNDKGDIKTTPTPEPNVTTPTTQPSTQSQPTQNNQNQNSSVKKPTIIFPVITSFTANTYSITCGQSVALGWSSQNAVRATMNFQQTVGTYGSMVVVPGQKSLTEGSNKWICIDRAMYTLSVYSSTGTPDTQSITINIKQP